MNNTISKRLLTLASMIDKGKYVYDVGCDHAYLDIYLTLNHFNECVAIDIHKDVIKIAKNNIEKLNLNIPVIYNDGLMNIDIKDNSVIVIAGMGTRTILSILKDIHPEEVIIQSNDDLILLRKTMNDWNYEIVDEKIVFEKHYYYVLIKFKYGNVNYNNEELLLGPILLKNQNSLIYINYLNYLLKKYNKMISNVPESFSENKKNLINSKNIIITYLNKIK